MEAIAKKWYYYIIVLTLATFSLPLSNVFSQDDTDSKDRVTPAPVPKYTPPIDEGKHQDDTDSKDRVTPAPVPKYTPPIDEGKHQKVFHHHGVPFYTPPLYSPPTHTPQQYTPPLHSPPTHVPRETPDRPTFPQFAHGVQTRTPVVQRHLIIDRVVSILPHHNTYFVFYVPPFANNARLTGHYSVTSGGLSFQHVKMYIVDSTACPSYVPDPFTCSQYAMREDNSFNNNISVNLEPGDKYYVGFDNPAFSTSEQIQANFVLEYQ